MDTENSFFVYLNATDKFQVPAFFFIFSKVYPIIGK